MGQKVNPIGFRTGITEDWKSKWYAPKAAYGSFLVEDFKLRRFVDNKLNRRPPFAAVSDILIERTREEVTVTIRTARPVMSSLLSHPPQPLQIQCRGCENQVCITACASR